MASSLANHTDSLHMEQQHRMGRDHTGRRHLQEETSKGIRGTSRHIQVDSHHIKGDMAVDIKAGWWRTPGVERGCCWSMMNGPKG